MKGKRLIRGSFLKMRIFILRKANLLRFCHLAPFWFSYYFKAKRNYWRSEVSIGTPFFLRIKDREFQLIIFIYGKDLNADYCVPPEIAWVTLFPKKANSSFCLCLLTHWNACQLRMAHHLTLRECAGVCESAEWKRDWLKQQHRLSYGRDRNT